VPVSEVPVGVRAVPLELHTDERGSLVEIFRQEWELPVEPVQWNAVTSEAGTLRGAHVHLVHADYLIVLSGRGAIGLRDIRPDSPTDGLATIVELSADSPAGLVIPTGVVHGFYLQEPALLIYAVTSYWHPDDELGCRWDDPELGISWPGRPRRLSDRDRDAPSFASMREAFLAASTVHVAG
jgi:dTDP-4-dehydrorhamnose 3,5-epimerase